MSPRPPITIGGRGLMTKVMIQVTRSQSAKRRSSCRRALCTTLSAQPLVLFTVHLCKFIYSEDSSEMYIVWLAQYNWWMSSNLSSSQHNSFCLHCSQVFVVSESGLNANRKFARGPFSRQRSVETKSHQVEHDLTYDMAYRAAATATAGATGAILDTAHLVAIIADWVYSLLTTRFDEATNQRCMHLSCPAAAAADEGR